MTGKRGLSPSTLPATAPSPASALCAVRFRFSSAMIAPSSTCPPVSTALRRGAGGYHSLYSLVGDIQQEVEPLGIEAVEGLALIVTVGRNLRGRAGILAICLCMARRA